MPKKPIDLIGQRFGRLLVIEQTSERKHSQPIWKCICDCGKEAYVIGSSLRNGNTQSCSCLMKESLGKRNAERLTRHGFFKKTGNKHKNTSLFCTWQHMLNRCFNPDCASYKNYGGRGITVCERWLVFETFLQDMGEKPDFTYTLDRINNDEGYFPENCRWASKTTQSANRRYQNTKGYRGISKRGTNSWSSRITYQNRDILLGTFDSELEALNARNTYILENGLDKQGYPVEPYKFHG